jgi:tetratricopeptide (TPR) repeat protein
VLRRSDEALEQALKLDPDSVNAATELIVHRTERGELPLAYRQASELLARRPDNSQSHGLMSYVLRYAGLLRASAAQCEATEQLDVPWPACSTTYMQLGAYGRARSMLRPDLGSEWSRAHGIEVLLRQGKTEEALRLGPPKIPGYESYGMLLACARGDDRAQIAPLAAAVRPDDDPEVSYLFAGHLAYCGQTDAAIRMLQHTVAANYCSWPAIDIDPFFNSIRETAQFAQVRQSAMACQSAFVHATGATPEGRP